MTQEGLNFHHLPTDWSASNWGSHILEGDFVVGRVTLQYILRIQANDSA